MNRQAQRADSAAWLIRRAMLELDQILRANEIKFAVLAALPAVLVLLGIGSLVRQYYQYQVRAELLSFCHPFVMQTAM